MIPAASTTALFTVGWQTMAEGSMANDFVDGQGTPAQDNAVWAGQAFIDQPTLVGGTLSVVNFNPFTRGDCNSDTVVNIADGVYLINKIYQGGPTPICWDACDLNDDGFPDISDAIYCFNYRFLDGAAPLAPFPGAGLDPTTGDDLGCNGDADDL